MTFGARLRDLRLTNNLSVAEAARAVGITATSWRRYEEDAVRGPRRDVVLRIARRFSVDVNDLLNEANLPAMADPEGEMRRAATAEILALLAELPLERLQAMPGVIRAIVALP